MWRGYIELGLEKGGRRSICERVEELMEGGRKRGGIQKGGREEE